MVSPTDLMKRVGVGGRLVPFFKCVCVYFAAGGGAPSATAVAAKCAPVLCLLLLVALQHSRTRYGRLVCGGLALSALGDALLVWPQHFVAGMAAFAAAHVLYIAAFGLRSDSLVYAAVLYAATFAFQTLIKPPGALAVLVPLYGLLLATMAWRGGARAGAGRGACAAAAGAGALLFLVSDALLGYSLFGGPVPHKQVLVMSTYYLGQLGIALSALEPAHAHVSADRCH
ncbi:lysoplasmalogenase TMEM86A [Amyelois transitella]|uniref:lysoplasmalogenase TMEM86A n=1 Tax=Amyelois transitella TaxID=680683 RepID=UPI00067D8493|nr:lysoplasmalogenase TMEM86A [Amyelois transitella]